MPLTWDEDKSAYAGGPAIADAAVAVAAPTKAEFDVAAATGSPTSVHCQELMPLSCQPVDVD